MHHNEGEESEADATEAPAASEEAEGIELIIF